MQKNLFATFATSAIVAAVMFPTVSPTDPTINSFAEPVGVVAMKTDDPTINFVGFVIGNNTPIADLPNAHGYNTVVDLQNAFNQFLIRTNALIIVGEHSYGIKRMLDSMFGNQIIDEQYRQQLEVLDLVGKLQSGNPPWNSINAYASANGLLLPEQKSIFDSLERISTVYTHHLEREIKVGVVPTAANIMPYGREVQAVAA